MGRHLGIDFYLILVVFGRQVGIENGAKIDPKRHRKNDEKKKGTKMAKKSLQDPARRRGGAGQDAGKGVGGRVNPSPKEGRKGIGTICHLKPPSHQGLVGIIQKSSLGASWSGLGASWSGLGAWNRLRGVLEPS